MGALVEVTEVDEAEELVVPEDVGTSEVDVMLGANELVELALTVSPSMAKSDAGLDSDVLERVLLGTEEMVVERAVLVLENVGAALLEDDKEDVDDDEREVDDDTEEVIDGAEEVEDDKEDVEELIGKEDCVVDELV